MLSHIRGMYYKQSATSTVKLQANFEELEGGQLWRAITQLVYVRFEKFKNSLRGNVKQYIFATGNFRESAKIREFRENFLLAKISCFTVLYPEMHWEI